MCERRGSSALAQCCVHGNVAVALASVVATVKKHFDKLSGAVAQA